MLVDGQIAIQAVATLQQIKQNHMNSNYQPFFLAAGFHKPHLPFYASSKYFDMYATADEIKLPANPDPPKDMPPIAWCTSSGRKHLFQDMKKYDLPDCCSSYNISMKGKECKIDAHTKMCAVLTMLQLAIQMLR